MTVTTPLTPPVARANVSAIDILRTFHHNAMEALPRSFLNEPLANWAMLIRSLMAATSSNAIRHIIIGLHEAFANIPTVKRVLGQLLSDGPVVSEGKEWKQQRHAMAPAFCPKQVDRSIVHVVPAVESVLNSS